MRQADRDVKITLRLPGRARKLEDGVVCLAGRTRAGLPSQQQPCSKRTTRQLARLFKPKAPTRMPFKQIIIINVEDFAILPFFFMTFYRTASC